MIEFLYFLFVHQSSPSVPDSYTVVHSQSWAGCRCQDVLSIRAPLADAGVAGFNRAYLIMVFFKVVYIHLACQITKAGYKHESTMRRE